MGRDTEAFRRAGFPHISVTCNAVPLQIEGVLSLHDGGPAVYVYLRARSGQWQFGVGVDQAEAVSNAVFHVGEHVCGDDLGEFGLGVEPREAVIFFMYALLVYSRTNL